MSEPGPAGDETGGAAGARHDRRCHNTARQRATPCGEGRISSHPRNFSTHDRSIHEHPDHRTGDHAAGDHDRPTRPAELLGISLRATYRLIEAGVSSPSSASADASTSSPTSSTPCSASPSTSHGRRPHRPRRRGRRPGARPDQPKTRERWARRGAACTEGVIDCPRDPIPHSALRLRCTRGTDDACHPRAPRFGSARMRSSA